MKVVPLDGALLMTRLDELHIQPVRGLVLGHAVQFLTPHRERGVPRVVIAAQEVRQGGAFLRGGSVVACVVIGGVSAGEQVSQFGGGQVRQATGPGYGSTPALMPCTRPHLPLIELWPARRA